MTRPAILLLAALILLLSVSVGCGSTNTMMNTTSTRLLQGITVTPSSADAQKFPNSQVQFMAAGTFTTSPMTVMSPLVRWSIGNPFATPTPAISIAMSSQPSIDANGLAQCNGFVGIATVEATAPADPSIPVSQMTAITNHVTGIAQLICP